MDLKMSKKYTRKEILKMGAIASAFAVAYSLPNKLIKKVSAATEAEGSKSGSGQTGPFRKSGFDLKSMSDGSNMKAIPTSCLQCVAICGIIGYEKDGRIEKIEGNPECPNNRGRICAKGQAGVNQVYDPDRILYPMKRVGQRGEGKWKRITWDEAYGEIVPKLKELRDAGKPEEFMFHYGRSRAKWVITPFTDAYGTKTVGNHTSICEVGKWTGQELIWGKHFDINDVANSKYILNFGANVLEAHTSHAYFAQRIIEAKAKGVKLVTFDVRLSNTAALSDLWVPVKPGTDAAVLLAMTNVILQNDLHDEKFITKWTNVTVNQLKAHYKQYTPEWAEKISSVKASLIEKLAIEYATNKPSTIITYRGFVGHYNGTMNERVSKTLDAIVGNINVKGGTNIKVSGKWSAPIKSPSGASKKLKIVDGENIAYPTHHVNHKVFELIRKGTYGRPKVYMMYCYNPVYVNGDCKANIETMKDEKLLPYIISVDTSMSESTQLADIILPDATYLERWDPESPQSYSMIPFVQIRQPVAKPIGEVKAFQDVCMELARAIGGGMEKYFPYKNSEEYMKAACTATSGLKDVLGGGFEYITKKGIFVQSTTQKYNVHEAKLSDSSLEGTVIDKDKGTIFTGKEGDKYTSYKTYKGIQIDGVNYVGFKPDKIAISGKMEIYSNFLKDKGYDPMPVYIPIDSHQKKAAGELILTSFKVNVQIHSRSQNCKYLTEIFHSNPAWINTKTATSLNIKDGDKIKVKSSINEIETIAKVTEAVIPGVIAISFHCGHWEYGRYASGKKIFSDVKDEDNDKVWWMKNGKIDNGAHPNWIIPNSPDPISGQWTSNDTVVKVTKI